MPSPISDDLAFAQGSGVIVPFPYSGQHAEKRRSALVVSGEELSDSGLLWVLMITTAKRGVQRRDLPIRDLAAAGLPAPCVVRPTKIACIEPARILRKAGSVDHRLVELACETVTSFVRSAQGAGTASNRDEE